MPAPAAGNSPPRAEAVSPVRRRAAHVALAVVAVAVLHGLVVSYLEALTRQGLHARTGPPPRLQALFVRTLQPEAPVWAPLAPLPEAAWAPPGPGVGWLAIPVVALAASAPVPGTRPDVPHEALPETPAEAPADMPPDGTADLAVGASPSTAVAETVEPVDPAGVDPAPTRPAFVWPPSTRLRYVLTGDYRGPIDGSAEVQWVREGNRYQVHLDVVVGLKFAPLIVRQMSSDGTLSPDGLVPGRYDERTRVLLRDPVTATLRFDGQRVQLASGRSVPQPPAVQDSVSQFVQLTWRFLMQPALLQPGQVLTVPLALPRSVSTWVYDVREPETLSTPVGPVEAVRVQPRRQAQAGGDLVAEMWFAPSLQSLPVRILIRQDHQTYVDLLIDRLPEQAVQPPVLPSSAPMPKRVP